MRHIYGITAALLGLTLAGAACNREPVRNEPDAAAEQASREAERAAEEQRQRNEDINRLSERVANLESDYETKSAGTPRGSAGTAAARVRGELREDLTNAKQAVQDLGTTTSDNWWDRHEQAMRRTADDVEADVKRVAGVKALPAPKADDTTRQSDTAAEKQAGAPFASARDRFVADMNAKLDSMEQALDKVKARGARAVELDDVRDRVKKLRDDVEGLKGASADDWWDLSKARVENYIDRLDDSIERLDDAARSR